MRYKRASRKIGRSPEVVVVPGTGIKCKTSGTGSYCNAVNSAAIQGNKVILRISRQKTVGIWDLNHPKSEPVVLYFENIV